MNNELLFVKICPPCSKLQAAKDEPLKNDQASSDDIIAGQMTTQKKQCASLQPVN